MPRQGHPLTPEHRAALNAARDRWWAEHPERRQDLVAHNRARKERELRKLAVRAHRSAATRAAAERRRVAEREAEQRNVVKEMSVNPVLKTVLRDAVNAWNANGVPAPTVEAMAITIVVERPLANALMALRGAERGPQLFATLVELTDAIVQMDPSIGTPEDICDCLAMFIVPGVRTVRVPDAPGAPAYAGYVN